MLDRKTILLVAFFAAACGGTTSTGGTTGSGGSSSTATGSGGAGGSGGASTATGAGGAGGAAIDCTSNTPTFPTFDKGCQTSADCLVKFHQINCCGTRAAIGIASSQSAAFDAAEATCDAMYPGCGCAQQPTTAEDGKTSTDETKIQVECKAGACSTFVP